MEQSEIAERRPMMHHLFFLEEYNQRIAEIRRDHQARVPRPTPIPAVSRRRRRLTIGRLVPRIAR